MGERSAIQWTDATWNPVTGCSKVSPGCAHCYAEKNAIRLWPSQYPHVDSARRDIPAGVLVHPSEPRAFTDVRCHEDRLDQPLRWRKPRKIFVNSMSDLFHERCRSRSSKRVLGDGARRNSIRFRSSRSAPERMRMLAIPSLALAGGRRHISITEWPLPNVWLGVSVENQRFADERIPLLLQTPAAMRFISRGAVARAG
jgi:protein gp37